MLWSRGGLGLLDKAALAVRVGDELGWEDFESHG